MLPLSPSLPTVVLVGRVNVGKSTLFNRLLGAPHSLVSAVPGTTRDTQEALVSWRGVAFSLIDTGGLNAEKESSGIGAQVIAHAERALARADLILFVSDAKEGLLPSDRMLASGIRTHTAHIIHVVNKTDNPRLRTSAPAHARLGFGEPVPVSAINGSGTGDLLDLVVRRLMNIKRAVSSPPLPPAIRIAIVGKPNVGKSTLMNAILGYERVIVSPYAHTTREPVDTPLQWNEIPLTLIDTAGIRRKARVARGLEQSGVGRSISVLERADVTLFVLDEARGIDDQDKQLGSLIGARGIGTVIVANKWDLIKTPPADASASHPPHARRVPVQEGKDKAGAHLKYIYAKLPFLTWAPIVFASALHGAHTREVLEKAVRASRASQREIPPEDIKEFFTQYRQRAPLPALGLSRRRPALVHFAQTGTRPPHFALAVRTKERFPAAYTNLLEKALRKKYDFEGTPIRVVVKTKR